MQSPTSRRSGLPAVRQPQPSRNDTGIQPYMRIGGSAMRYPRRRAITACQLCRARKTKCDNQRPSCRSCLSAGVLCQYEDRRDHSSFDPASLEIIDRLNRIIDSQSDVLNAIRTSNLNISPLAPSLDSESSLLASLSSGETASSVAPSFDEKFATGRIGVPSSNTTPDNVLIWPIFDGKYPEKCLQDVVFGIAHSNVQGLETRRNHVAGDGRSRAAFREDRIPVLMERFFHHVHIKNPILDESSLKQDALAVVEDGLGWDESSCLVLLACALGAIATPFRKAYEIAVFDPREYRKLPSLLDSSNLEEAEMYFTLARRRIGILTQSVSAVQCYILSGVYFMYTFRPLDAFQNFHQASITYQIYSKSISEPKLTASSSELEQRLFWSCFKSECEILSEIDLPHSGVSHLDYIDIFPRPPNSESIGVRLTSVVSPDQEGHLSHGDSTLLGQEQAWFYYLSEIALRRIGNRVLDSFYKEGFQKWTNIEIPSMIQVATEFLRQLNQWYDCLPAPVRFDDGSSGELPDDELPWLLYIRLQEIRSWICRPFLFLAVHSPPSHLDESPLAYFVEQALYCHTRLIKGNSLCHRHHGTWYMLRLSITSALCLLAAFKVGLEPPGWKCSVDMAVENLRYWETEAPGDIKNGRMILENILRAT